MPVAGLRRGGGKEGMKGGEKENGGSRGGVNQ